MATIWLVHGFRVSDSGAGTIGKLQPDLERHGLKSDVLNYPWVHLIRLEGVNRGATKRLLEKCQPDDGIITHSNGAAITMDALDEGLRCAWIGHVNPALWTRRPIPPAAPVIDVWHNRGDLWAIGGKWWRRFTNWLPWRWRNPHDWGEMGRVGYLGYDGRVTNHELPRRLRHSGALHDEHYRASIAMVAARRMEYHQHENANLRNFG